MSDEITNSMRRGWNNDGMDPDWRPSFDSKPILPPKPIRSRWALNPIPSEIGNDRFHIAIALGEHEEATGPLIEVIKEGEYQLLHHVLKQECDKSRKLQFEIDTRWAPALKKAQNERDVFQQELMDKHEEMVRRVADAKAAVKEKLDNFEKLLKARPT